MRKTLKPMMTISAATLMMVSFLLCGCESEKPKETKETKEASIETSSTETSSTSSSFDDAVADSDKAKKKEEITNKKADVEVFKRRDSI